MLELLGKVLARLIVTLLALIFMAFMAVIPLSILSVLVSGEFSLHLPLVLEICLLIGAFFFGLGGMLSVVMLMLFSGARSDVDPARFRASETIAFSKPFLIVGLLFWGCVLIAFPTMMFGFVSAFASIFSGGRGSAGFFGIIGPAGIFDLAFAVVVIGGAAFYFRPLLSALFQMVVRTLAAIRGGRIVVQRGALKICYAPFFADAIWDPVVVIPFSDLRGVALVELNGSSYVQFRLAGPARRYVCPRTPSLRLGGFARLILTLARLKGADPEKMDPNSIYMLETIFAKNGRSVAAALDSARFR